MIQFRASGVGRLMSYPERTNLPDGALSYLYELESQLILDWQPELDLMVLEKGRVVEDQSIALLNQVTGSFYIKNTQRITTELLTGEWDIDEPDEDMIWDIKSAYSKKTFPTHLKEGDKKIYEWQLDTYMLLRDMNNSGIAYTLVDTPDYLIKKGENPDWHVVSHIKPEWRITMLKKQRDTTRENQLLSRCRIAQDFLCELLDKRGYKFENHQQTHATIPCMAVARSA